MFDLKIEQKDLKTEEDQDPSRPIRAPSMIPNGWYFHLPQPASAGIPAHGRTGIS